MLTVMYARQSFRIYLQGNVRVKTRTKMRSKQALLIGRTGKDTYRAMSRVQIHMNNNNSKRQQEQQLYKDGKQWNLNGERLNETRKVNKQRI